MTQGHDGRFSKSRRPTPGVLYGSPPVPAPEEGMRAQQMTVTQLLNQKGLTPRHLWNLLGGRWQDQEVLDIFLRDDGGDNMMDVMVEALQNEDASSMLILCDWLEERDLNSAHGELLAETRRMMR